MRSWSRGDLDDQEADARQRARLGDTHHALFSLQAPMLAFLGNDEIPRLWLTAKALTSEGIHTFGSRQITPDIIE